MSKLFLVCFFFSCLSFFSFCADEENENQQINGMQLPNYGQNIEPLPVNNNPPPLANQPDDPVYDQLQDKWCYEKFEYHWWNISACGCRMIGGFAGTVGYLALGGSAICTTLLGFTDFESDVKFAIGAVGITFTALSAAAFKIRTSSFEASINRENFADDMARTGAVSQQHLNQAAQDPPV